MEPRHRETWTYWFVLAASAAFLLGGASLVSAILSMSLTGRVNGGASLNVLATAMPLLWLASIGAYIRAMWVARGLSRSVSVFVLARGSAPADVESATVWWWARASAYGLVAFLGLLLAVALVAMVFDPWR